MDKQDRAKSARLQKTLDKASPLWSTELELDKAIGDEVCKVWYGDGDLLATVYGNLGLDITEEEIAEAIVALPLLVRNGEILAKAVDNASSWENLTQSQRNYLRESLDLANLKQHELPAKEV